MGAKSLSAVHAVDPVGAEDGLTEALDQVRGIIDGRLRLVPFEELKLDVMHRPAFSVAKRMGELINRPGSLGQQPLHEKLGARLKPSDISAGKRHFHGLDMSLGQDLAGKNGRIRFDEAARAWSEAHALVRSQPEQARRQTESLARTLLDRMLGDGEMCIRLLSGNAGEGAGSHAMNVTVIALLLGRARRRAALLGGG